MHRKLLYLFIFLGCLVSFLSVGASCYGAITGGTTTGSAPQISQASTSITVTASEFYFKFIPLQTGVYTITTSPATTDTEATIYYDISELTGKPADLQDNTDLEFYLTDNLTAGNVYYLRIHEFSLATVTCTLSITGGSLKPPNNAPTISITNPTVDKKYNGTQTISVSGSVTETDGDNVTISATINGKQATTPVNGGNGAWTLTWSIAGNIAEGTFTNTPFTANDGYGGTNTANYTGNIIVDKTLPAVTLSSNDADGMVKQGNTVTITAVFNEDMANTPTISITNGGVLNALMTDSGNHRTWTYAWTVPAGNTTATATVAGTDTVGNAYAGGNNLTFTLDNTPPTLTLSHNHSGNIVKQGNAVTITVVFNENMANSPTISITNGGVTAVAMTDSGNHRTWTYTWTVPAGNTTATATVAGTDAAGNAYAGGNNLAFTIDNTAPTVTLSDNETDNIVKQGNTVTITAVFNEDMANSPAVTITSGGITAVAMTDSGNHRTWTYTWTVPAGNAAATATVAGTDTAGNAYAGSNSLTFTIDNTAPTVTLSHNHAGNIVKQGNTVIITAVFNEDMANSPAVTITNGGVTAVAMTDSGNHRTWTYTWTVPTGNTAATATVAGTDAAGNAYAGGNSLVFTIDNTAPTVTLSDNDTDNIVKQGNTVTLTAVFNKDMANSPAVTITNGGVTSAAMTDSGTHRTWTYTWTVPAGNTTATVAVTGTDTIGNAYAGGDNLVFTIDNQTPTPSSLSPANNALNVGINDNLIITFSENVKIGTGNITLYKTADDSTVEAMDVTGGQVTGDTTDTITVNPSVTLTGQTGYYIKIAASAFHDIVGNNYAGISDKTTWKFTTKDITPPNISSVTLPGNATYITGQNLDFTVNFSEAVTVNTTGGTPYIPVTINTGGTVLASYHGGSGTTTLVFRYTVKTGDQDSDGISVGGSINANGGSVKDGAGNDATLTLNGVGVTSGIKVDGVKVPTITFIKPAVDGSTVNISTGSTIIVSLIDNGAGINANSIQLQIDDGTWVKPTALIAAGADFTLYYIITGIDYHVDPHTATVSVKDAANHITTKSITFHMEVKRNGFGFGKLRFN